MSERRMTGSTAQRESSLGRNRLGVVAIVFMVLAGAGPLAAMFVGLAPSIGVGNGVGTPGVYVLAGGTLALFAVGYVAMSRHIVNVGAFYSYVRQGLNRPLGFSTAMVALLAYGSYVIALVVFFGIFASASADSAVSIAWNWKVWAIIGFVATAVLAYFTIEVSAKVLAVLMLCEIALLVILDLAIVFDQGPSAYPLDSFAPGNVLSGAIGVSVIFAFSSFVGFEATANFGEEARSPRRTIPRATYLAITLIGLLYILTAWSMIAGYGAEHVVAIAQSDPDNFVFAANSRYVGLTDDLMSVLICTSLFAALLMFHNATARYMYALARDSVLPRSLTRTHQGAPYVASAIQLAFTAAMVVIFVIAVGDSDVAAGFLGLGSVSVLVLELLVSLAVVGFFRGHHEHHWWRTAVAPVLASLALATAIVLSVVNFADLSGAESAFMNKLWIAIPVAALLGLGVASTVRSSRPVAYEAFGTQRFESRTESGYAPEFAIEPSTSV